MKLLTRRGWLAIASALPVFGAEPKQPEISAFDLSLLDEWTTPNELFFVREHFPTPAVSLAGWKIKILGRDLSFELLSQLTRKQVAATLECTENPPGGGLVSHALWEGVPLYSLLGSPAPHAKFVQFTGADGFTRAIPAEKALHPDTLLAFRMNGQPLPASHGGPARILLPGWYGMNSVKWAREVSVADTMPAADDYRRKTRSLFAGAAEGDPVTAGLVKAVFSRPLDGAVLSSRRFIVRGAAWAGERRVGKVEVSVNGGGSWAAAKLESSPEPYCWVHWSFPWRIPKPGDHQLLVRASDDAGNAQPAERASSRIDPYEQNQQQRIQVTVL